MTKRISDVMTKDVVALPADAPVVEAAKRMRESDVGPVMVTDGGKLAGIVTDRDIVVRAIAEEKDPRQMRLSEIASTNPLQTLSPNDTVDAALQMMREGAVRRLPVVEGDGTPVGMVSIADLATEDGDAGKVGRTVEEITDAPPNT